MKKKFEMRILCVGLWVCCDCTRIRKEYPIILDMFKGLPIPAGRAKFEMMN